MPAILPIDPTEMRRVGNRIIRRVIFSFLLLIVASMGGIWYFSAHFMNPDETANIGSLIGFALVLIAAPIVGSILLRTGFSSGTASKQLLATGTKAPATIAAIIDTNITMNNNPFVVLGLNVRPPNDVPFNAIIPCPVSRIAIPRIGEEVTYVYDPKDPKNGKIVS